APDGAHGALHLGLQVEQAGVGIGAFYTELRRGAGHAGAAHGKQAGEGAERNKAVGIVARRAEQAFALLFEYPNHGEMAAPGFKILPDGVETRIQVFGDSGPNNGYRPPPVDFLQGKVAALLNSQARHVA
nr:hypothetical protein [Tanacetum cinerariifolium]